MQLRSCIDTGFIVEEKARAAGGRGSRMRGGMRGGLRAIPQAQSSAEWEMLNSPCRHRCLSVLTATVTPNRTAEMPTRSPIAGSAAPMAPVFMTASAPSRYQYTGRNSPIF